MILAKAEKKLKRAFRGRFILSSEKQDKYFLMKEINFLFPEFQSDLIYKAIDRCNELLHTPMSKEDFIRVFLDQILFIVEREKDQLNHPQN